jgi:uncharacterized OsmC-like protein
MDEQKNLNGMDVAEMRAALATISTQAEKARQAPKASRVRWMSGLKFKAHVRNHTFIVDEPTHLTGEDESPNSMEYVLGAYGACLATGFLWNATQRGIAIRNMEVVLESTQNNVFTFLGIDPEGQGHSGFETISAKLYIQANADEAAIRELWDLTVKTSPVGNSLARNVTIKPELDIIP